MAGFVAALRIFFRYGLVNKSHVMDQASSHKKEGASTSQNLPFEVSNRSRSGPYRPPHLRKKVVGNQQRKDEERLVSPRHEFISSDSDCSDNDGSMMDSSGVHFAKARLAAILCIQVCSFCLISLNLCFELSIISSVAFRHHCFWIFFFYYSFTTLFFLLKLNYDYLSIIYIIHFLQS